MNFYSFIYSTQMNLCAIIGQVDCRGCTAEQSLFYPPWWKCAQLSVGSWEHSSNGGRGWWMDSSYLAPCQPWTKTHTHTHSCVHTMHKSPQSQAVHHVRETEQFWPVYLRGVSLNFGTLFHYLFCNFSTKKTQQKTTSWYIRDLYETQASTENCTTVWYYVE